MPHLIEGGACKYERMDLREGVGMSMRPALLSCGFGGRGGGIGVRGRREGAWIMVTVSITGNKYLALGRPIRFDWSLAKALCTLDAWSKIPLTGANVSNT